MGDHFKLAFLLTPIGVRNILYNLDGGRTGYTDIFIFGIRIARIQRTTPW